MRMDVVSLEPDLLVAAPAQPAVALAAPTGTGQDHDLVGSGEGAHSIASALSMNEVTDRADECPHDQECYEDAKPRVRPQSVPDIAQEMVDREAQVGRRLHRQRCHLARETGQKRIHVTIETAIDPHSRPAGRQQGRSRHAEQS